MTIFQLVLLLVGLVLAQDEIPSVDLKIEHRGENCNCMKYWECINADGNPYSYCGLTEDDVCCVIHNTPNESKPKCGVKGFDSGHVGIAEPSEWPWHAAIVEEPGFYYVCGGALVDESWVLTAAHCVQPFINQTEKNLKVRLGEYDVASSTEGLKHEDRAVASIITHPQFEANTLTADIALLRLISPVTQRAHIDVVCLPQNHSIDLNASCFLTGWGKTTENGGYSEVLKEIPIPLWDDTDCQIALEREFGKSFRLSNSTLCAGATGHDACDGDGGGPLVCQQDGQWFQHGIVSFGFGCARRGIPGVYTRVSSYQKWIHKTVLTAPGVTLP